jgi:predicted nucleic acid-binding protein
MSTVFDASALLPLITTTAHSAGATSLHQGAARPIAPTWALLEVSQALWKWARAEAIAAAQIEEKYETLTRLGVELVDATSYVSTALAIALARSHSVCDCLYVATALAERADLVTADTRLASVAGECGVPVTLLSAASRP